MGTRANNQIKVTILTEVAPSLKEAFREWWQKNGFASEADAIRYYVRKVTNFDPESQQNSCLT